LKNLYDSKIIVNFVSKRMGSCGAYAFASPLSSQSKKIFDHFSEAFGFTDTLDELLIEGRLDHLDLGLNTWDTVALTKGFS
jgi:hypothetical protein